MREWAVALLALATLSPATGAGSEPVVLVRDPDIVESSGLVARPGEFLTVNDSGARGVVYVVDARSGRTVGRTAWASAPTDVEALAPGRDRAVWVADIGDNGATRGSVSVARVQVSRGDAVAGGTTYRLRYPDGPHDAEALLVHPRTGRLFVATKEVLGGGWYAAPRRLRSGEVNRLRRVGRVGSLVTDGAFLPDGRRFVLRDYARATVYAYPCLQRLATIELPEQEQGEGLAVAQGWLYLSSEGVRQPILRVPLPDVAAGRESCAPRRAGARLEAHDPAPDSDEDRTEGWRQARRIVGAAVAAVLLVVLGMRLRRTGQSRRR